MSRRPKKSSTAAPKAVLRERLFVPTENVTDAMREAWTYEVPDPDGGKEDKITIRLYRDMGKVQSFCRGDLGKIRRVFKPTGIKIKDRRVCPPMTHPITMRTTLYTPESPRYLDR